MPNILIIDDLLGTTNRWRAAVHYYSTESKVCHHFVHAVPVLTVLYVSYKNDSATDTPPPGSVCLASIAARVSPNIRANNEQHDDDQ